MKQLSRYLLSFALLLAFLLLALASSDEKIKIVSHSMKYVENGKKIEIYCHVKNNTRDLVGMYTIKAIFYDEEGNAVGEGFGLGPGLKGSAEDVVTVWANGIQNFATYEVQIDGIEK